MALCIDDELDQLDRVEPQAAVSQGGVIGQRFGAEATRPERVERVVDDGGASGFQSRPIMPAG